jgi:hypothetical protein
LVVSAFSFYGLIFGGKRENGHSETAGGLHENRGLRGLVWIIGRF